MFCSAALLNMQSFIPARQSSVPGNAHWTQLLAFQRSRTEKYAHYWIVFSLCLFLPVLVSCRDCPEDLKEAISSIVFAAPRSSDLPELMAARQIFGLKYGKEFILAAEELRPGCCVNRRVSAACCVGCT